MKKKTCIGSKIYKIINGFNNTVNISLKKIWEKDLEKKIDFETWTSLWQKMHKISNSAQSKKIILGFLTAHIILRENWGLWNYVIMKCGTALMKKAYFFTQCGNFQNCKNLGWKLHLFFLSTNENIPLNT